MVKVTRGHPQRSLFLSVVINVGGCTQCRRSERAAYPGVLRVASMRECTPISIAAIAAAEEAATAATQEQPSQWQTPEQARRESVRLFLTTKVKNVIVGRTRDMYVEPFM